jgi:hypothetical protein
MTVSTHEEWAADGQPWHPGARRAGAFTDRTRTCGHLST